MSRDPLDFHAQSFSPRISRHKTTRWEDDKPALVARIRTRYLAAAALAVFAYCAGLYLFGDGAGW